jgi:hypothetical protein
MEEAPVDVTVPAEAGAEVTGDQAESIPEDQAASEKVTAPSDEKTENENQAPEAAPEEDAPQDRIVDAEAIPGVVPAHVDAPAAPPPMPAPVASSGPGTFGIVFGGLLAGAIGFLVATFAVPEGWPNPRPADTAALDAALAAQSERIDALSAELDEARSASVSAGGADVATLETLTGQLAGVETRLAEAMTSMEERLSGFGAQIGGLETRLGELQQRPAVLTPDGSAAMEAQMEAFRQQLDEVTADAEAKIAAAQAEASEIEAAAAAAAEAARREAALASLRAALDSGTGFADTLASFTSVPEPLEAAAAEGVATLTDLQASFPVAARQALASALVVPEEASAGERFSAFLRRQTNARSLAPREGDDADAVLSRAEAALTAGDLDTALSELSALPDSALAAMGDWMSAAEARAEAVRSVDALENATN